MESLPSEIITQILEYLPFNDRRVLARVNKVFYHAASHPLFARKETFIYQSFNHDSLNYFNNFKDMLLKSNRQLLCLKFFELTFIEDIAIFTNLGNHIISLYFKKLHILNDSFLDAIAHCCNLEKLEFKTLLNIVLTDRDRKPILKLNCISLDDVPLCDRDFNQILKLAPNLKDLSILDCKISGGNLIIQRFYPHSSNNDYSFTKYNSNDIFSETNIVYHLNNFVRLNSLSLNECSSIIYLIQPIQLGLKSLTLDLLSKPTTCSIDNDKLILALCQCVYLEQLDICHLPVKMLSTVSKLFNLRHLSLTYIDNILPNSNNDECLRLFVESLKNLKYIRSLTFVRATAVHHVNHPIYPFPECMLKALVSLDCYLHSNLELLKFGKNLTSLQIRNGEILVAEDLLSLFRNLTNLKNLQINNCKVLNDEIFIQLPISNLKELISLKLHITKISHRSLQHITSTSLKVLVITNVSLEPDVPLRSALTEFKKSVHILSLAVPSLTVLELYTHFTSMRTIESKNLFVYFHTDYLELLKSYFKSLKILKLW